MRIAVVGPTYPLKGGVAQHTTALATRLARAGHQVRMVSWAEQYPKRFYPGVQTVEKPEVEPFEPVEWSLSWKRPDSWVRTGRSLRGVDLVVVAHITHVQAIPYRLLLAAMGRRPRPRIKIICHNVLGHERSPGDRTLVRTLLHAADAVIVHSQPQAEVAATLKVRATQLVRMPPHLPAAFVASRPQPGEHRRLLFFGLVRPYKGVDVLLAALARAPADVRLRVAGEFWGGTSDTEQLCRDLGVTGRVELVPGYVPAEAVPELFADVDAMVLPYRSATGSQAVWMAFQFGVPAIATAAGELAVDIRPGVDGLVVAPGDVDGLAAALNLFYQPGSPEQMRSHVSPVDPEPFWAAYLSAVVS